MLRIIEQVNEKEEKKMSCVVVVKEDISSFHMSQKALLITVLWSIKLSRVTFSCITDIFWFF